MLRTFLRRMSREMPLQLAALMELSDAEGATLLAKLEGRRFHVIPVDLSESHKAGGSVFCLKQSY